MRIHNTKTREQLTAIMKAQNAPISLEEMHRLLQKQFPGMAFSTVYRLVKNLEDEGKVMRVDWRERGSHYEWAERRHHHHIVCSVCGKTADIDDSFVQFDTDAILKKLGFSFGEHHVELEGICAGCRTK